jgi:flagellar hook-associated protein 3 FlgL
MRVTPTTMFLTVADGLQGSLNKVQDMQARMASGRRVNRYSDAPADATTLGLRARERDWAAFSKAADDATGWLATQDQALQSTSAVLRRVKELTLSAANGIRTPAEQEAVAVEVTQLRDHLAGLANSSYLGRPVFGGFGTRAVVASGTTWAWAGAADATAEERAQGVVKRRVAPDVEVQINMSAETVFGFGGSGPDVFALLDRIAADARSGNIAALGGADLADLDTRMTDVGQALATVGSRANQIESLKYDGDVQVEALRTHRSSLEDADLAETVMELQMAEAAYQAVLGATARLSMPSLANFLS